ncbi:mobile mystery protein B [Mesorhizobium sp. Mes31]|uniref:mobile mystery protein B n=1 Tax=Mesorhizobium sp. Mes31 TaxID=2926017 RepID=UPI0021193EB4|nr:mobile mystery protein B [Mesorhizobium sp. Mes31]
MKDIFTPLAAATPIQPDDQKKLIPTWIQSRDDLNVAEEDNIAGGLAWAHRRKLKPLAVATDAFSRKLHKAMFGKVWNWAGEYRRVELDGIGVPRWQIAVRSAELFDQFHYWIESKTFPPDEIAVRFHHQLVFLHAYTNGNGRHSRMMGDLLIESLGGKPFTWGSGNLQDDTGALRKFYIASLKKADNGDITDLLAFARS